MQDTSWSTNRTDTNSMNYPWLDMEHLNAGSITKACSSPQSSKHWIAIIPKSLLFQSGESVSIDMSFLFRSVGKRQSSWWHGVHEGFIISGFHISPEYHSDGIIQLGQALITATIADPRFVDSASLLLMCIIWWLDAFLRVKLFLIVVVSSLADGQGICIPFFSFHFIQ